MRRKSLENYKPLKPSIYTYALDYLDDLRVTLEGVEDYEPHPVAYLRTLREGLDHLNRLVKEKEVEAKSSDTPWPSESTEKLITCFFNWYSVTVCDYVRTIGRLAFSDDRKEVYRYLNDVIPVVYHWRRKIGAHATFEILPPKGPFEFIDKSKLRIPDDKFVERAREQMYMFPTIAPKVSLLYRENVFLAGAVLGVPLPSGDLHVEDMTWSVTHTHRELSKRYWPDIR